MLKKANIQWSAKQLTKSMEKGTINFDNSVQRGLVWDNERKSLLIHSMIENYPIPAFYASKDDNGYSMLDGKQRSNAIADFINGKFALTGVPEMVIESEESIDINGLTFAEISEEIQDAIKDYSLTVYYFDGITEDEITEMFFRLNNGKPLSAIELTRVKAKSIDKIKELSRHNLFISSLTEQAILKYTNEDIVIKSWALLNTENPSFETKSIRPVIESADITNEHVKTITTAYDRILTAYTDIKEAGDKEALKLAKRIITRTHLLSIVPIAVKSIADNVDCEDFESFIMEFFSGKKSASINEVYNNAAGSGSAKAENVKKRITAITEAYEAFLKKNKGKVKSEPSTPTKRTEQHNNYTMSDGEWEQSAIPHEVMGAYNSTINV